MAWHTPTNWKHTIWKVKLLKENWQPVESKLMLKQCGLVEKYYLTNEKLWIVVIWVTKFMNSLLKHVHFQNLDISNWFGKELHEWWAHRSIAESSYYMMVIHYRKLDAWMKILELKQEEKKFQRKTLWNLVVNFAWLWLDTLPHSKREAILRAMHTKQTLTFTDKTSNLNYCMYNHKYKLISNLKLYNTYLNATKYQTFATQRNQCIMAHILTKYHA